MMAVEKITKADCQTVLGTIARGLTGEDDCLRVCTESTLDTHVVLGVSSIGCIVDDFFL